MVRCNQIIDHLSEYLDKEATLKTRQAVEEHLRGCERCYMVYDSTRKLMLITGDGRTFSPPAGFFERLHRFLDRTILGRLPSCVGTRSRWRPGSRAL